MKQKRLIPLLPYVSACCLHLPVERKRRRQQRMQETAAAYLREMGIMVGDRQWRACSLDSASDPRPAGHQS